MALELHVSDQGPLGGVVGLVLAYDRGGPLSGGLGMGLGDFQEHTPPLGLFGRARLLRFGRFAFGVEGSVTREDREAYEASGLPGTPYTEARAHWSWAPGYRADLQAFAEISGGAWSLRFEAGAGVRFTDPDCTFTGFTADGGVTSSACSQAPPAYHWDKAPDRYLRPVSLILEHRLDFSSSEGTNPSYRSPETAYHLSLYSTILPILVGSVLIATGVNYDKAESFPVVLGGAAVVLGTTFGPSVGYVYARDNGRGIGHGFLRLLGVGMFVAGTLAYASDNFCEYCQGSSTASALLAAGAVAIVASVVSSIYDVAHAAAVARRENEGRGLSPSAGGLQ